MSYPAYRCFDLVGRSDAILEVLLKSERKGNPFGQAFWEEMPVLFEAITADESVRAVILATDGPHFSYGLDLIGLSSQLMPAVSGGFAGRRAIQELGKRMQLGFDLVANCPKPVIAAVNGWCIGAGVELIAACDIRVCSQDAKFSLREVKLGMVPDLGGIQRVPLLIGEGHMRQMALTGEDVSADRAAAMGLVNSVHGTAQEAREAARSIAAKIASNPPRVVAGVKEVLNARSSALVADSLRHALMLNTSLMQSDDFKEAVTAFMERREPVFKGK